MGIIEDAIRQLRRWERCPSCDREAAGPVCAGCGVELTSAAAKTLAARSEAAARALEARQQALAVLLATRPALVEAGLAQPALVGAAPVTQAKLASSAGTPVTLPAAPSGEPPAAATPHPPQAPSPLPVSAAATRSNHPNPVAVFSAVGVGALVAAAVVFAFLVPADPAIVRLSLTALTVASALAVVALRRRRPVSAAALAVGTVALSLLVAGLSSQLLPTERPILAFAAVLGGLAVGLVVAGFALRVRPWVSAGILLAPPAAALAAGNTLIDGTWWAAGLGLVAAIALAAAGQPVARRWRGDASGPLPLSPERTLLQVGAALTLLATIGIVLVGAYFEGPMLGVAAGPILLAAAAAAYLHGELPTSSWRAFAGAVAVLAPFGLVVGLHGPWLAAGVAAAVGWMLLAAFSGTRSAASGGRAGVLNGGWCLAVVLTLPTSVLWLGPRLSFEPKSATDPLLPAWTLPDSVWAVAALLAAAACAAIAAFLPSERFGPAVVGAAGSPPGSNDGLRPSVPRFGRRLWPWLTLGGLASAALLPVLSTTASVALLLVVALFGGLVAARVGNAARPLQAAGRIGGAIVLAIAALASWAAPALAIVAGAVVVLLVLGWTRLVPAKGRPILVGLGYGYALCLLGYALVTYPLGWRADDPAAVAGLVSSAASLTSLIVLSLVGRPRVPAGDPGRRPGIAPGSVYVVLGVGLLPWLLVVVTVLKDRSWWAAGAALAMLLVEFGVATRVHRQPTWLRVAAAVSLLPTAGIVLVNAGAMLIPVSGSPILLPIVAALAVGTAIASADLTARIAGIDDRAAGLIRRALEGGSLLTAVACVLLAVVLPAAGPATSLIVCAVLAAGSAVVATRPDRKWVWLLSALAGVGVLWSALVLLDVVLVEAYTVPAGVAAALSGVVLARRQPRWWSLAASGLALMILPTLVLAAVAPGVLLRASALTAFAVGLALLGPLAKRRPGPRRVVLWAVAGGIALAGLAPLLVAIRSSGYVRVGDPALSQLLASLDSSAWSGFAWVLGSAAVAALLLAGAAPVARWASVAGGVRLRRAIGSWRFAPALTVAALGAVLAVRPGDGVVAVMWLLCAAFLAVTVVSTRLRTRGRVLLPPVWYCWGLALLVGVAGWTLRELRVEHHSLILGPVLLACGVLSLRAARRRPNQRRSWPIGYSDPAWAITPGVLATLGPSTVAIGTDPQTWRAILVLVLALAALLVGARRLWKACLIAGIVDLVVAILLVFVARRGAIDAVPWLIALVGAGGVLLGLGMYSERRQHRLPVLD